MTDPNFFGVAYYIGAPATAAIATSSVFLYFLNRKNKSFSNGASEKSVDFWRAEIRDGVSETIKDYIVPILASQTDILKDMKQLQNQSMLNTERLIALEESRERRHR